MSSSRKSWHPAALVALTAVITLLLVASILYLRPGESAFNNANQGTTLSDKSGMAVDSDAADLFTPRLVAVKIRADWCARTPEVAPIFADMTSEYGSQPILFVTLDITDETSRQQARYMAKNLGINAVYDDPFESGMVKLIDRQDGQVLSVLTAEEHRPEMESVLAMAILPRN